MAVAFSHINDLADFYTMLHAFDYDIEVRFVKRYTVNWGYVWQTIDSYSITICEHIKTKIKEFIEPDKFFEFYITDKNKRQKRTLSFIIKDEGDSALFAFYAEQGQFDVLGIKR